MLLAMLPLRLLQNTPTGFHLLLNLWFSTDSISPASYSSSVMLLGLLPRVLLCWCQDDGWLGIALPDRWQEDVNELTAVVDLLSNHAPIRVTQRNGLSPKIATDPINIGCSFQNKQPRLTDLVVLLFNYNNEELSLIHIWRCRRRG